MKIGFINSKTTSEGPGELFALWVVGCPFRCKGCCNPQFLDERSPGEEMSVQTIYELFKQSGSDGIAFLGGDPMTYKQEVSELCEKLRKDNKSVVIYTGYYLSELKEMKCSYVEKILENCDLLIDGRYEESLRTTSIRWVGSTNQTMHFLSNRYSKDDPMFKQKNTIEITLSKDGEVKVNGWPTFGDKNPLDGKIVKIRKSK